MRVFGVRSSVRRSVARLGVVALTVAVALTPALSQAAEIPGIQWNLGQGHNPGDPPVTPKQPSGTAAGKAHHVSAAATRATSGAKGHAPGKSPHELPADKAHGKTPNPHASGNPKPVSPAAAPALTSKVSPVASGKSSFDATSSVRQGHMGDARTAVYKNADGTYTAQLYPVRTQYQLPDSSWAPIDLTLVAGADGRLHRRADSLDTSFAATSGGSGLMTFNADAGHGVSFSLAGAQPVAGRAAGDTVTYPGVVPGADLALKADASGVKESLVLQNSSAPTTWVFPYQAKGLTAKLDATTGDVDFVDANGKTVVVVPHGSMTDSKIDPVSHDPAWSGGVTYSLVTYQGSPALQVSLDSAWLTAPQRVYPVTVDPTSMNDSSDTYVETVDNTGNNASSPVLKVGSYDGGTHKAASYLAFTNFQSTFNNDWIRGAWLNLYDVWDAYCRAENVYVSPVTGPWTLGTISDANNGYPGAPIGNAFGIAAFDKSPNCLGTSGTANWERIGLNASSFDHYAHGSSFYGLAVWADTAGTSTSWKQFASNHSANIPYLNIDYSPYAALWPGSPTWTTVPTALQAGVAQVPVENWGNTTWTPSNGYVLHWTQTNKANGAVLASGNAAMSSNIGPQQQGTVTVTLPPQPAGVTVVVSLDMWAPGNVPFSSYLVPTEAFAYTGADIAPQIDGEAPASNVTLTTAPTLIAYGHDPDNYPSGLQYGFWVCPGTATWPANCASSGWLPAGVNAWTVPAGTLAYGQPYYWITQNYDGTATSWPSQPSWFATAVDQPVVTSHLAQNTDQRGYDPESGNYTTAATDLTVPGSGMPLQVQRTYNSLDPRASGAFGASWSSAFDMRAAVDSDGTGNVVITYPTGQAIRFGHNPDSSFTAPSGRFSTLKATGTTGYTLTDKDGTIYVFSGTAGASVFPIASITDHSGHGESFSYTAGQLSKVTNLISGRALHITWNTPTGAGSPHIASVATDPLTGTDQSTAITATYGYTGDQLTSFCLPKLQAACTRYTYTTGSHDRSVTLDADPASYWRLDDPAGSPVAASQVIANEGSDNATSVSTTFGAAGPTTTATGASFDGSTSFVQLPNGQVQGTTFLTLQLWFKTSATGAAQMLYSTGHDPANAANPGGGAMPVLYVGTDGKLHGHFWDTKVAGMASSATVTDGAWHQAVLTASGTSQVLYLDGAQVGTESGQLVNIDPYDAVGAGVFNNNGWPAAPGGNVWSHFNGQIADVAFYQRALSGPQIGQLYSTVKAPSTLLTQVKLPSGNIQAAPAYDTESDRLTQVTDSNGSVWGVGRPTVSGTSTVYRSAVLGSNPYSYWRLGDAGGTTAADQTAGGSDRPSVYSNVTLGVQGPFGPNDSTAAQFNGTNSNLLLQTATAPMASTNAVEMWFSTTNPGVLLSLSADQITSASTTNQYTPVLYVGTDGKLYGQFRESDNSIAPLVTSAPVTDGKWHHVVISTDGLNQQLYLDGAQIGSKLGTGWATGGIATELYVGAGFIGGNWPAQAHQSTTNATGYPSFFNGSIAEVAYYEHQLSSADVAAHFKAFGSSVSQTAPTMRVEITDPSGKPLTYTYDPFSGGRLLTATDTLGATTTYGYDSGGYLNTVTDPNGDVVTTGHDVRGNVVSKTTCQMLSAEACDTAYYTYYPDDTSTSLTPDPRNDQMTTYRDGRSSSPSDPTYLTRYAYDAVGDLISTTTPPGSGFPSGKTQTTAYTDGSSTFPAADSGNEPSGLVDHTRTPNGAVTTYRYFHNGDVYSVTDAAGLVTRYGYDALGRVLTKTQISDSYPSGLATTYTYDAAGRVLSETDPATGDRVSGVTHTPVTTTVYGPDGQATSVTISDATGGDKPRQTINVYDSSGRLHTTTDPTGAVTTYGYDAYGDKNQLIDAAGNETDMAFDPDGRLLTTTLHNYTGDPVNPSTAKDLVRESRAYDPAGRLASVTDAMGRTTDYTYYDNGRLNKVFHPDPTSTIGGGTVTEERAYDGAGNVAGDCNYDCQVFGGGDTGTNTSGSNVYNTYDASNLLTFSENFYGTASNGDDEVRRTSYAYDPDGHQTAVATSDDAYATVDTTNYTYDPLGRVTSKTVQDSSNAQSWSASLGGKWNLDDGATTVVPDGSAANHPGTLAGNVLWSSATHPNGDPGGSAQFDATPGESITTSGPAVDTSKPFTVSAWVNLKDTSTYHAVLSQDGTNGGYGFWLGYDHNLNAWAFTTTNTDSANPSTWYSAASPAGSAKTGVWTHLVGAFDGTRLNLYVNGNWQSRADNWPGAFNTAGPVQIGGEPGGKSFSGNIQNVGIYSRALSWNEIVGLYDGITSAGPGLNGLTGSWSLTSEYTSSALDTSASLDQHAFDARPGSNEQILWSAEHGGSAAFDGTDTALEASNTVDTGAGKSFTVTAWAKLTSAGGTADIVSQSATQSSGFDLQYDSTDNAWAFSRSTQDVANPTVSRAHTSSAPALGVWTHLAGVYDATKNTLSLYVNGSLAGTATDTTPIPSAGNLVIGRGQNNAAPAYWFTGKISGVQAYYRALSATEIGTVYSGGSLLKPTNVLTTTWTLDQRGLVVAAIDPRGNAPGATKAGYTTTYTNDEAGRRVITTLPTVNVETAGGTPVATHPMSQTGYDTFGDAVESQDANGNITATAFDGDGRTAGTTSPSYTAPGTPTAITGTVTTDYTKLGQIQDLKDPLGNITSFTYDQLGDTATKTDPPIGASSTGGVSHTVYYPDGKPQNSTDPTGAQSQATYDYMGRVATSTKIVRQPTPQADITTYGYDSLGDVTSIKSPSGVTTSATYDYIGERTTSVDGAGNTTYYYYNEVGLPNETDYPDGTWQTVDYDLAGRPVTETDYDATNTKIRSTSTGYDLAGNQIWTKDALNNQTTFAYDAANRLTSQAEPVTANHSITTTYGYDAAGNRTRYTDGNGQPWITTYNPWNLLESTIEPSTPAFPNLADRTTTRAYDQAGRLATIDEPGGVVLSQSFDALGNVTKQTGTGAETATVDHTYSYDTASRLTSVAAPGGTDAFTLDDRGELLSASGPSGASSFAYNADGAMNSRTDAAGAASYGYDTAGRLSTITDPLTGSTLTYGYNEMDEVSSINYGTGGDVRTFGYDGLQELTSDTLKTSAGATVASIGYGYNLDGNLTSKNLTGFAGSATNTYTYDFDQRLTSWNNGTAAVSYGYDDNSNRTTVGAKTFTYNARNQLTSDGTNSYTYRARGTLAAKTPASGAAEAYTFDAFDRMITDGPQSYTYDGLDRVMSAGTATGFAYSGTSNTLATDGAASYSRDPSGNLIGVSQVGVKTLAYTDRHGDVVGQFQGAATALTSSVAYDPLGAVIASTSQTGLGFQSGWTDKTTGKVDMASRWYDPATGQFASQDTYANSPNPLSANANAYGYGDVNPLDMTDPSGHSGTAVLAGTCTAAAVTEEIPGVDVATDGACVGSALVVGGIQLATMVGGWFGSGWLVGGHKHHGHKNQSQSSSAPTYDPHDFDWLNSTISNLVSDASTLWTFGNYVWNHLPKNPPPPCTSCTPPPNKNQQQTPPDTKYYPPAPPPPPTPAQYALQPAAHAKPPKLGQGSGIDYSPTIVKQVLTALVVQVTSEIDAYRPHDAAASSTPASSVANGGTGLGGCSAPMGYQCTASGNYVDLTTGEVVCGKSSLSLNESCANHLGITPSRDPDWTITDGVKDTVGYAYQQYVTGQDYEERWSYLSPDIRPDGGPSVYGSIVDTKAIGGKGWEESFYNSPKFDEMKLVRQTQRYLSLNAALNGFGVRFASNDPSAAAFFRNVLRDWFPDQMEDGTLQVWHVPWMPRF